MKVNYSNVSFGDRGHISRALRVALGYLDQPDNVSLSVSMVDKDTIHMLNNRDRQVNRVTDVLSYPYLQIVAGCKVNSCMQTDSYNGDVLLGDIIICRDIAVEQANSYGHSVRRELCYLAVHSLLHLLGYDHTTDKEEQLMTSTAKSIMDKAGINR